jgi:hypothetical protein
VDVAELLEGDLLKTVEAAEASGRFVARGYADEMGKLADLFNLTGADIVVPTTPTLSEKADAAKVDEDAKGEAELASSVKGPEGARLLKVLVDHLGGE